MDNWGVTLYRRPEHPHHWILHSQRAGWLIFPAKFNGWDERKAYPDADPSGLQRIPTWLAFNTGLLEAIISQAA